MPSHEQLRAEELTKLGGPGVEYYGDAAAILDRLCLSDEFLDFLTLIAYEYLD